MDSDKLELIKQALAAAESSLSVAKRLIGEIEHGDSHRSYQQPPSFHKGRRDMPPAAKQPPKTMETKILPGTMGFFNGQEMVTSDGAHFPVPANYVSKSLIVAGDQLKMVEEDGETKFKQIQRVKRKRLSGVVVKKDGKFAVVTEEGSFKVPDEAVNHHQLALDDKVDILTSGVQKTPWAVIEKKLDGLPDEDVTHAAAQLPSEPEKTEKKKPEHNKDSDAAPKDKEEKPQEKKIVGEDKNEPAISGEVVENVENKERSQSDMDEEELR